jgi:hypothetical protein
MESLTLVLETLGHSRPGQHNTIVTKSWSASNPARRHPTYLVRWNHLDANHGSTSRRLATRRTSVRQLFRGKCHADCMTDRVMIIDKENESRHTQLHGQPREIETGAHSPAAGESNQTPVT